MVLISCQKEKKKPQSQNPVAPVCFTEELEDKTGIVLICEGVPTIIKHGVSGKDGPRGSNGSPGQSCSLTDNTITCGQDSLTLPGAGGCSVSQKANGAEIKCTDGSTALVTNGKDGIKGEKGDNGNDGQQGIPGAPGSPGRNGNDGATGSTGPAGKDGLPGPPGDRGPEGARGLPGPQGKPGDPGRQITKIITCNGKFPAEQYDDHDVKYSVFKYSDGVSEAIFKMYIYDFNFPGLFTNSSIVPSGSSDQSTMPVDLLGFNGFSAFLLNGQTQLYVKHRKSGGYSVTINCVTQ